MTRARATADTQDNNGGSVPPLVAGKNFIINGGFDIWQRGTSFTGQSVYSASFLADRWNMFVGTNGSNFTLSRQSVNDSTNLPNIQYCLRVARNSGQTTGTSATVGTSIEILNSIPLAGRTVTVSFYARKGTDYSGASSILNCSLKTGTGTSDANGIFNNYTGQAVVINNQQFALTTTWQRFTATGTLGSTTTQIALEFVAQFSGTSGANDFAEITGVQLEAGSVATPFSRAGGTLQGELAACQRYYWRQTGDASYGIYGTAINTSGNNHTAVVQYPVPMRVTPTSLDYSTLAITDKIAGTWAITSLTIETTNATRFATTLNATAVSGLASRNMCFLVNNNNTSAYLGFSAEL